MLATIAVGNDASTAYIHVVDDQMFGWCFHSKHIARNGIQSSPYA